MASRITEKHRCFANRVTESLLTLAVKLRDAELRVNGRTLQTSVPLSDVTSGISSSVNRGRFHFHARGNLVKENNFKTESIDGLNADVHNTESMPVISEVFGNYTADSEDELQTCESSHEIDTGAAACGSASTVLQQLALRQMSGPSLWPVLSSVSASGDTDHVDFLEKNSALFAAYNNADALDSYLKPLSETDLNAVVDNAIDTVLRTRSAWFLQRNDASGFTISANSSQTDLSKSLNADSIPSIEDENSSQERPPVVSISKRYAAAIANPRRFKCKLCPYSTNNRSHVRRHHISVHSATRPFRCYVCDKDFARLENAKVHMLTRHPEVPYDPERLRCKEFFMSVNKSLTSKFLVEECTPDNSADAHMPESMPHSVLNNSDSLASTPQNYSPALANELDSNQCDYYSPSSVWNNVPHAGLVPPPNMTGLQHGYMGSHPFQSIPQTVFPTNSVWGMPPLVNNTNQIQIKQERDTEAGIVNGGQLNGDHHVCMFCRHVCQTGAELVDHVMAAHNAIKPPQPPSNNPGYVFLQTAAPIFLLPQAPAPVMPLSVPPLPVTNKPPTVYQPILPKLPVKTENSDSFEAETLADQRLSSVQPSMVNMQMHESPHMNINHSVAKAVLTAVTQAKTPASANHKPSERKRQFKTFYCCRCPDRAPFRYEKSYEKHLQQHRYDDRARRKAHKQARLANFGVSVPLTAASQCDTNSHAQTDSDDGSCST